MSNYKVISEDDVVTICRDENCDFEHGFLDIYLDDEDAPSPFNNLEDAELFAKIIVKLLDVII